jgi:predicted nucleotidyltransferase
MVLASGEIYYTQERIPEIEASIDKLLQKIVSLLIRSLSPSSIILHGSLARGEGTVLFSNGKMQFVSDIEIGCVTKKWWKRSMLSALQSSLEKKFSVEITLSMFLPARFNIGRTSNWVLVQNPLTLEQYELISGLRVLWGFDPRQSSVLPSPTRINNWDVLRLIFNRVAELVDVLISKHQEPLKLKKNIAKLLMAYGDTVLLLSQQYHFSYMERKRRLSDLVNRVKSLPKNIDWGAIINAYEWKVAPIKHKSVKMSLYTAIDCLVSILRWGLGEILLVDLSNNKADIMKIYLRNPRLSQFCRSFPGKSLQQSALILCKQIAAGYVPIISVASWREVHYTYAQLVNFLTKFAKTDDSITSLSAQLSPNDRLVGANLVRKWKAVCCMV